MVRNVAVLGEIGSVSVEEEDVSFDELEPVAQDFVAEPLLRVKKSLALLLTELSVPVTDLLRVVAGLSSFNEGKQAPSPMFRKPCLYIFTASLPKPKNKNTRTPRPSQM